MFILRYENRSYYLFGDNHKPIGLTDCDTQQRICDKLDVQSKTVKTTDSNCWHIIALLAEWFKYNYDNKIKTDFYVELNYGKVEERSVIAHITPLRITEHYFNKCLTIKKELCQYYPYVHFHYADPRRIIDPNSSKRNWFNLFSMDRFLNNIMSIPEKYLSVKLTTEEIAVINFTLISYIKELFSLCDSIAENAHLIYDDLYMGNNNISHIIQKYKNWVPQSHIGDLYINFLYNLEKNIGVNRENIILTRTSSEYNLLMYFYSDIAVKLRDYIHTRIDIILDQRKKDPSLSSYFGESIDKMYEIEVFIGKTSKTILSLYKQIHTRIKSILEQNWLVPLGAEEMDIYLLSRMYIQQKINSNEVIIVFAGGGHITAYADFFINHLGAETLYYNIGVPENACITVNSPYFDPYKYRNNYIHK
jgi:hypothetical protein